MRRRRTGRDQQLTKTPLPEPEPRRSVRATKGQHKALEQLDQPIEAPKRRGGGKKSKKAAPEPEEPEDEVIRCVCGATEQDEDSGEPWIACDQCGAWQHNICMGMSQYTEDLPNQYFCEICRPENHKELLAGIARGERPWEARRRAYEEEKAEKKKRGPKKGKKRTSDLKEDASQKSKQSPPPAPELKREQKGAGQKRKNVDGPQEKEAKVSTNPLPDSDNTVTDMLQKIRKANDAPSSPVPGYSPPADIPGKIAELPDARQGPTKALSKSLAHSLAVSEKNGTVPASDGLAPAERAERFALQIERAVHDTHAAPSAYAAQIRTLAFNLKSNPELCIRLLNRTLTPPMLAVMTTEELASKELQKETAEMRARAEKQAIKITEDVPRIRRTHKGDEIIGDDGFTLASEEVPSAPVRRPSAPRQEKETPELPSQAGHGRSPSLVVDTQQSPSRADFDINKVFSSVRSPTLPQTQVQSSLVAAPAGGPGFDPDVDRLLDDGTQSPPYSPKDENDPDVVWRGNLLMNGLADVPVAAKHIAGANLSESISLPWDQLIPSTLSVCGRIDEQQATVYLCSMRYSLHTDLVVVQLEPTSHTGRADMQKLIQYFISKKRYGVIGDKGVANVRDTYLIPVLPGGVENHPEFIQNLADNYLPETRTEHMMLAVFVYRNDPETIKRIHGSTNPNEVSRMPSQTETQAQGLSHAAYAQHSPGTPTPTQAGFPLGGRQSISAPAFSPTVAQGPFPTYPSPRNSMSSQQLPPAHAPAPQGHSTTRQDPAMDERQRQGEAIAREILGPLMASPTVSFLLPQAHVMTRKEWEIIKRVYEQYPETRDDLPYLSKVLENGAATAGQQQQKQPQQPQPTGPSPPPLAPPPLQQQQQPHPNPQPQPQPQHQSPAPQQHQHQPSPAPARHSNPTAPQPIQHLGAGPGAVPPRQTPIPPPPIPPQAAAATAASARPPA